MLLRTFPLPSTFHTARSFSTGSHAYPPTTRRSSTQPPWSFPLAATPYVSGSTRQNCPVSWLATQSDPLAKASSAWPWPFGRSIVFTTLFVAGSMRAILNGHLPYAAQIEPAPKASAVVMSG